MSFTPQRLWATYMSVFLDHFAMPILAPLIRQNATVRGALLAWNIEIPLQSWHLEVLCCSWIEDP